MCSTTVAHYLCPSINKINLGIYGTADTAISYSEIFTLLPTHMENIIRRSFGFRNVLPQGSGNLPT